MSAEERFFRLGEVDCMMSPFVYGETIHSSICELLLYLKEKHALFQLKENAATFYDLGAGTGKPSVTAALALPDFLSKCVGIELLDSMYKKSLELAEEYNKSEWKTQRSKAPELTYESYDFLEKHEEWAQADIVFANATCFDKEMLSKVSNILNTKFREGSVFILTSHELSLD